MLSNDFWTHWIGSFKLALIPRLLSTSTLSGPIVFNLSIFGSNLKIPREGALTLKSKSLGFIILDNCFGILFFLSDWSHLQQH